MPRPFTRNQVLENRAFLCTLRRTGNVREACRELGIHRAKMTKRRAKDAAFAADWDAALVLAHAALNGATQRERKPAAPRVLRTASGRLQLRRVQPRQLTPAAEQAFLAALSATANIRLSAKAAGFSHSAFYQRREESPGFAREWRLALEIGYQRLEAALIASIEPDSCEHDGWTHNDPPPIPSMTAAQALQLMYLHQKEVRLQAEPPHLKRRRGECHEAHSERIRAMGEARLQREREKFDIAEAARRAAGKLPRGPAILPPPPELPALDQVTGWSNANPAKQPHGDAALFGGWRLKDWEGRGR